MPCFHPKRGFEIGTTAKGAPKYKIVPWSVECVREVDRGVWKGFEEIPKDRDAYRRPYLPEFADGIVTTWIPIPCGNCLGCRLDYARDWSARLMHEYQMHDPNECWFITFTYDDAALAATFYDPSVDRLRLGADSLGEAAWFPNLDPRDMTLFWKRLRKYISSRYPDRKIVYFQAGEYGERRGRCHYHAIVYDLPLDQKDLHENGVSELGHTTWRSDLLERLWRNGNVIVGKVTLESCAYVARYTLKKAKEMWEYDYTNRVRPFVRMSRNPGIGCTYVDAHPELFSVSRFPLARQGKEEPYLCAHPRYYMKLLRERDDERYNELKFDRAVAGILSYEKACMNQLPYLDQLKNKELDLIRKSAKMKRKVD